MGVRERKRKRACVFVYKNRETETCGEFEFGWWLG